MLLNLREEIKRMCKNKAERMPTNDGAKKTYAENLRLKRIKGEKQEQNHSDTQQKHRRIEGKTKT